MKRFVLLLALFSILGLVMANPIEPIFICRFWFDDAGDLNVHYRDPFYTPWDVDLFDGVNHYVRQINSQNPATLTQVYPDAVCTAQAGYLLISNQLYDFPEEVHWGPGDTTDITPLAAGQCGIQFYLQDGMENIIKMWGKDLVANPVNVWYPAEVSELRVFCHNQAGTGIAGVPVYIFTPYVPWQQTGADGWMIHSVVSTRLPVYIKDPQTNNIVYQTNYFSEPGQPYTIELQMAGSAMDEVLSPEPAGTFKVQPSVLRSSGDRLIHLEYDGKLRETAQAELYDLKGRLITSTAYYGNAMSWQLPKLASGIYFIQLQGKGSAYGRSKLIVLK